MVADRRRHRLPIDNCRLASRMPPELIAFAKRYLWLSRSLRIWKFFAPEGFRPAWLFALGRWISPYQVYREKVLASLRREYPDQPIQPLWRRWLDNHIRFVLDFLGYTALNSDWVERSVAIESPECLDELRQTGGLLLTYHMHHQNTLCCVLGTKGIKISAIASPPEDSPLFLAFPALGRWAKKVNEDSAKLFSGGSYIFTNNVRKLVRQTREELSKHHVVLCLCDINVPDKGKATRTPLLNREISPPTGTIELTIKLGAPIYLAYLVLQEEKLRLSLKKLDASDDIAVITKEYFSYLESFLQIAPWSWQGWEWYGSLPSPTTGTPT